MDNITQARKPHHLSLLYLYFPFFCGGSFAAVGTSCHIAI